MIPFVPVRQHVLSLPPRLRYLLAYDHRRCSAVLRIFARAVRGFYRARAARAGVPNGHTGAVTFIQRFGSAANLNLHFHMLVLDGVFTEAADGALQFHPARPLTNEDVVALLATMRTRIERWLERAGLLDPSACLHASYEQLQQTGAEDTMDLQRGVDHDASNLVELPIGFRQFGVFGALAVHSIGIGPDAPAPGAPAPPPRAP